MEKHQIVIGAVIVALAILAAPKTARYQIESGGGSGLVVHRLDAKTGEVESCLVAAAGRAKPSQPDWCKEISR